MMSGIDPIVFKVEDMTCGHCVKTITNAVQAAFPNAQVSTDLSSHQVTVTGGGDPQKVADIIKDEGYTPQIL